MKEADYNNAVILSAWPGTGPPIRKCDGKFVGNRRKNYNYKFEVGKSF